MMSNALEHAAKVALDVLRVKKIFWAGEDDEYYYFSGCGDHGEPLIADCSCCVSKNDFKGRGCYFDDPLWSTPKRRIELPMDNPMFIKLQDPLAEWGLSSFE